MIELFGGTRDFAGNLRRLFGARGTIQPMGSDVIQPVVDVGPGEIHIFTEAVRFTSSWIGNLAGAAALARNVCATDPNFCIVIDRLSWWSDPATTLMQVRVRRGTVNPPFSSLPDTGQEWREDVPTGQAATGTVRGLGRSAGFVSLANLYRSSEREGTREFDAEALWVTGTAAGQTTAFEVEITNGDVAARDFAWFIEGRVFPISA